MEKIIERIKTKPGYKFLGLLLLIYLFYHILEVTSPEYYIKNGKAELYCDFGDGYRLVPKEKIVGYIDDVNYWAFTNGYARNCYVAKK